MCRDLNDTIARIIDKQDTTDNAELINTLDRESLQFVPDKKSVDSVPFIDNPFLQFEIVWRGTLIQCLIETHFDYVDFSFFADLSNDRSKGETPDSYRKAAQVARKRDLSNVYEGFWAEFINNPPDEVGRNDEPANQPKPSASFFGSVWRAATGFFDVGPKELSDQGCGGR